MKKVYLDIDDTLYDTYNYLRSLVVMSFGTDYIKDKNIYEMMEEDEEVKKLCMNVLSDYSKIPTKAYVKDFIRLLSGKYDVVLCSMYVFDCEREAKEKLAKKLGVESILVKYDKNIGKSNIDMSDGIFVDDSIKLLNSSNANRKILVGSKPKDNSWSGDCVEDCLELLVRLLWEEIE